MVRCGSVKSTRAAAGPSTPVRHTMDPRSPDPRPTKALRSFVGPWGFWSKSLAGPQKGLIGSAQRPSRDQLDRVRAGNAAGSRGPEEDALRRRGPVSGPQKRPSTDLLDRRRVHTVDASTDLQYEPERDRIRAVFGPLGAAPGRSCGPSRRTLYADRRVSTLRATLAAQNGLPLRITSRNLLEKSLATSRPHPRHPLDHSCGPAPLHWHASPLVRVAFDGAAASRRPRSMAIKGTLGRWALHLVRWGPHNVG
ncbi:hypothetical protein M885DRAFT_519633 [Pelagophyceae sp. CCMP2097]|nr:hypothetical protein M885DRAFT_519633 [Pelagophyceae sp. CCMP2097]